MRVKAIVFFTTITVILVLLIFVLIPQESADIYLDIRKVNDIVKTLADDWAEFQDGRGILPFANEFDYVVVNRNGKRIAATREGLNEHLNDAIRHRDTIVNIIVDGDLVGFVIFNNNTVNLQKQSRDKVLTVSLIMLIALLLILGGYTFYLYHIILRPFNKLQGFARHIATGNLDIPLEMDRNNLFGAFTESFDLMREELHKAREKEREAERSKKELVASLSHDIKTPIASIKSATELMLFATPDEENREQLNAINAKVEQIDSLITNMFHATLEELQELNVSVSEINSTTLLNLIRYADYKKRVKPFELPSCLISGDLLRLGQVFDNIISNSYKYAGTDIEIHAFFAEQYLVLDISDFGAGVPEDEISLLFNKFYRGKDVTTISGYGLGLYISKFLMEQMGGEIRCENRPDGFCVRLLIRLA